MSETEDKIVPAKPVKLETGAEINVPAFIEQGELVKVDTRNAEYLERVKE